MEVGNKKEISKGINQPNMIQVVDRLSSRPKPAGEMWVRRQSILLGPLRIPPESARGGIKVDWPSPCGYPGLSQDDG